MRGYPDRSLKSNPTDLDETYQRILTLHEQYFVLDSDGSGYFPKAFEDCLNQNTIADIRTSINSSNTNATFCRNELISGRLDFYNVLYGEFKREIYSESSHSNLTLDVASIAAGVGGTLATKASVSQIWSGLSAGFAGLNASVNKNVYFDQTMPSVILFMDANRTEVRARVIEGMAQPYDKYSLGRALDDLEAYYQAGSIPGAIAYMAQQASNSQQNAKDVENNAIRKVYAEEDQAKLMHRIELVDNLNKTQLEKFIAFMEPFYTAEAFKARTQILGNEGTKTENLESKTELQLKGLAKALVSDVSEAGKTVADIYLQNF